MKYRPCYLDNRILLSITHYKRAISTQVTLYIRSPHRSLIAVNATECHDFLTLSPYLSDHINSGPLSHALKVTAVLLSFGQATVTLGLCIWPVSITMTAKLSRWKCCGLQVLWEQVLSNLEISAPSPWMRSRSSHLHHHDPGLLGDIHVLRRLTPYQHSLVPSSQIKESSSRLTFGRCLLLP